MKKITKRLRSVILGLSAFFFFVDQGALLAQPKIKAHLLVVSEKLPKELITLELAKVDVNLDEQLDEGFVLSDIDYAKVLTVAREAKEAHFAKASADDVGDLINITVGDKRVPLFVKLKESNGAELLLSYPGLLKQAQLEVRSSKKKEEEEGSDSSSYGSLKTGAKFFASTAFGYLVWNFWGPALCGYIAQTGYATFMIPQAPQLAANAGWMEKGWHLAASGWWQSKYVLIHGPAKMHMGRQGMNFADRLRPAAGAIGVVGGFASIQTEFWKAAEYLGLISSPVKETEGDKPSVEVSLDRDSRDFILVHVLGATRDRTDLKDGVQEEEDAKFQELLDQLTQLDLSI